MLSLLVQILIIAPLRSLVQWLASFITTDQNPPGYGTLHEVVAESNAEKEASANINTDNVKMTFEQMNQNVDHVNKLAQIFNTLTEWVI